MTNSILQWTDQEFAKMATINWNFCYPRYPLIYSLNHHVFDIRYLSVSYSLKCCCVYFEVKELHFLVTNHLVDGVVPLWGGNIWNISSCILSQRPPLRSCRNFLRCFCSLLVNTQKLGYRKYYAKHLLIVTQECWTMTLAFIFSLSWNLSRTTKFGNIIKKNDFEIF